MTTRPRAPVVDIDRPLRGGLAIILALLAAALVLPLVMVALLSFDARPYLGPFPPQDFSLQWYRKFFGEPMYLDGLKTSAKLAAATALISPVIGVLAGIGLRGLPRRSRAGLSIMFQAPQMVPGVVIGFAILIFFSELGIGSTFTRLLAGHVLITFPFCLRATLATLELIRPSYVEAAQSLGASPIRAFFTVTLPLLRTAVLSGALLSFAFSFDDVAIGLFLSDPHAFTLPVALVRMMYANFDLTIAAVSMLQLAVTLAIVILFDRLAGIEQVIAGKG